MLEAFPENKVVPTDWQPPTDKAGFLCPICGRPLHRVRGRRGTFLGCSGYPDCRFTRPLSS